MFTLILIACLVCPNDTQNVLFNYWFTSFISGRSLLKRLQAIKTDTIYCHQNFISTRNKKKKNPFPDMYLDEGTICHLNFHTLKSKCSLIQQKYLKTSLFSDSVKMSEYLRLSRIPCHFFLSIFFLLNNNQHIFEKCLEP